MSYSWQPHMQRPLSFLQGPESQPKACPARIMALVDAGQLTDSRAPFHEVFTEGPAWKLFEGTFASGALAVSPVLSVLSPDAARATEQLEVLDTICSHLPILSILVSSQPGEAVLSHLRALMSIMVNDQEYFWRFADTQMMQATASTLTEAQRRQVYLPFHAWYVVDHGACLHDLAADLTSDGLPITQGPLVLDDIQHDMLMDAVAVPSLACQLRAMTSDFGRSLTHAGQTAFAAECLRESRKLVIDEDAELLAWSLERWGQCVDRKNPLKEESDI